jgi:tetratricopeptide (TPR) repeat protein
MSEYTDFVESRRAQKDSEYQTFVKSRLAQKKSAPSNAAVAASSAIKGVASIPDMFINAAPNLIGLGMAGTGFVSNELADVVGRDNGLGRYLSKVNELANSGLENFQSTPSIVNRGVRAVLPIADPATEGQRVMDWGVQTATGTLMNPTAGAKGMALNALKLGAAGTVGGVVAEKTGSPIAGIAASIAAPVVAGAVGSRLNRIPQSVTATGRENVAGRQMLNAVADPKQAIAALENAPRPTVARSKATSGQVVAQATGDTGLLKAEDILRQRIGVADDINQRYAANAEARRQQLLRMMRDPDSAPNAVKMARDEINNLAQKQAQMTNEAARRQQTSMLDLGANTSADDAAQRLAAVSDPIVAAKKLDISNKFEVDPFGEVTALRIPAKRIESVLDEAYGGLSVGQDSKVRTALKLINEAAGKNKAAKDIPELNAIRPEVPKVPTFNRTVVNPQLDDMLTAVAKYGGISRAEAERLGLDSKMNNMRGMGGLVPFPKTGGMTSDEMAMRLQQDGYPVDLLDDALRGYKVYAPQGHELMAARADAERNLELFNEQLKLNPDLLGSTMTYKQMREIEKRIGAMQRAAYRDPEQAADAAVLTQLKHLIRGSMDDGVKNGNVPKDIYDNYKIAMKAHADFKQQHDQGAAADLLINGFERRGKNIASVPTKMLSTREGLDSFKKAIGGEAEARQALSDRIATTFRNEVLIPSTGGTKSGWQEKAIKWQSANKLALDEFPELRSKIGDSIKKSKTVDEMAARFEQDTKKMLSSGGRLFDNQKDPSAVIDSFLASKSRLADSQFIVKMANDSPQFKTSLRGAIAEKVSGMNNAKTIEFIENKANRELINGLFGDTVLRKFDRVLIDAKRDRLGSTLGGVSGSQTFGRGATDKIMNQSVWKLDTAGGTLGAALGALLGGGVGGTVGAAAGGASTAHLVKMMNMKQNATTSKAMLDPKYGAELLKKQLAPTPYKAKTLGALMKYAAPSTIPAQDKGKK